VTVKAESYFKERTASAHIMLRGRYAWMAIWKRKIKDLQQA